MLKILSLVIVFFSLNINLEENTQSSKKYGIVGQEAPTFDVKQWIDKEGNPMEEAIQLTDNAGKVKVIYGFQSWCPGCHSHGLPALQKMVKVMEGNNYSNPNSVQEFSFTQRPQRILTQRPQSSTETNLFATFAKNSATFA